MDHGTTVLGVLRKARELVSTGQHFGILEAIGSLRGEVSGPTRDRAYHALLETATMGRGAASLEVLGAAEGLDAAVALVDATIQRITATLH